MTAAFEEGYPSPRTWRCDQCGGPVTVEDGYVIWDRRDADRDFRIIHQSRCDDDELHSSMALRDLVGVEGIASLLSLLTVGPLGFEWDGESRDKNVSLTDFADLFRRLHVPNYERARQHFGDPRVSEFAEGWNERALYMPDTLAQMAAVGEAPDNG